MTTYQHLSVLKSESIEGLKLKPEGLYVDCTLGLGGHAAEIAKQLTSGLLIANDLDDAAIAAAKAKLEAYSERVEYRKGNYKELPRYLKERDMHPDGILMDLGVSSYQLDAPERGFSYMKDAPLDMRMNQEQDFSAYDVVNGYGRQGLKRVFYEYGEEKLADKIAAAIVREREIAPIETTGRLSKIVIDAYPPHYKGGHPAKRVFQAIRIEVNGELDGLKECVEELALQLKPGGRMAVITFHSLEDRIVKQVFQTLEQDCICDKRLPICVCGKRREVVLVNKKPITASEEERKNNKRSESAKLRIIERV